MAEPNNTGAPADLQKSLLRIIKELVEELSPGKDWSRIDLDSRFEDDLGIDSLARIELLSRIEKELHMVVAFSL
jgi:acyl carrier protein